MRDDTLHILKTTYFDLHMSQVFFDPHKKYKLTICAQIIYIHWNQEEKLHGEATTPDPLAINGKT